MSERIQVHFWGTRGSCPAPFPDRMVYGGNTACVSVQFEEGIAVFDAGTGIVALGQFLEEERKQGHFDANLPIYIFIGHLHLDHIQGLPFFPCLFWKGADIHICGCSHGKESFRTQLGRILGPPYWPVSIEQVPADVSWLEIRPGDCIHLPGEVRVRTMKSEHPNGAVLYRLEKGETSVVYGLDCEPGIDRTAMWEAYRSFAGDSSLLIFDAPYTQEEYPTYCGFGHSFWEQGIRMAEECHTARLCICHHDWRRTDEDLAKRERELAEISKETGIWTAFAREGMCIDLKIK